MMRSALRASTLVALTSMASLTACAGGAMGNPDPYRDTNRPDEIHLEVMNNNFSDATLHLWVRGARRDLLGQVTGKTSASFTVPWTYSEPVRIEIDLVAGPRCVTRSIDVDPGDELRLEIQSVFTDTRDCQQI